MENKCNGLGCFGQDKYGNYHKIKLDCPCELKTCPNVAICGSPPMPEIYLRSVERLCVKCDLYFGTWRGGKGKLVFYKEFECPICLEYETIAVSYPACDHYICTNCFKKCFKMDSLSIDYIEVDDKELDRNLEACSICRSSLKPNKK